MDFTKEMETARRIVEDYLGRFFAGEGLEEAMRYSLLRGMPSRRRRSRRRFPPKDLGGTAESCAR